MQRHIYPITQKHQQISTQPRVKILLAIRQARNDLLAFFRHSRGAHKMTVCFSHFKSFPILKYILSVSVDLLIIVSSLL